MKQLAQPSSGDVWLATFDPIRGREQAGSRPALVVSVNKFNHGPAELVVVIPITSRNKFQPWHVQIQPPEGGLKVTSFIKVEDIRSISKERLTQYWGKITPRTRAEVEERIRILLDV